jgi:hypothetical protein
MRTKHRIRPRFESLDDRVVLSGITPAVTVVPFNHAHFHTSSLTFKGSYVIPAAYGPNNSFRYLSFGTFSPTNVSGLGPLVLGGTINTHGPGLAMPVHPLTGNSIGVNNYNFSGANPANPGQFNIRFIKKVAPPTPGYTLAYTFTISFKSGQFAGATGGGKVELKLSPKPPLVANAPAASQYTGQCTIRFHFNPSTVLT